MCVCFLRPHLLDIGWVRARDIFWKSVPRRTGPVVGILWQGYLEGSIGGEQSPMWVSYSEATGLWENTGMGQT